MKPILIFDYDGTLHNCMKIYEPAFLSAYQKLTEQGYVPPRSFSSQEIVQWIGYTSQAMWNLFQPNLADEVKAQGSQWIGEVMIQQVLDGNATWYPGAQNVLNTLKEQDYTMLFLSNCKTAYMEAHRAMFQLDHYFSGFFAAEQYQWIPKYDIFPLIQQQYPANAYLVIGDRFTDMEIAEHHGLLAIGCAYGFGQLEEFSYANTIAQRVTDLPHLIATLS